MDDEVTHARNKTLKAPLKLKQEHQIDEAVSYPDLFHRHMKEPHLWMHDMIELNALKKLNGRVSRKITEPLTMDQSTPENMSETELTTNLKLGYFLNAFQLEFEAYYEGETNPITGQPCGKGTIFLLDGTKIIANWGIVRGQDEWGEVFEYLQSHTDERQLENGIFDLIEYSDGRVFSGIISSSETIPFFGYFGTFQKDRHDQLNHATPTTNRCWFDDRTPSELQVKRVDRSGLDWVLRPASYLSAFGKNHDISSVSTACSSTYDTKV